MAKEKKIRPLQPATREKKCTICSVTYIYPEKDSQATRRVCDLCINLSPHEMKVIKRLNDRIIKLEKLVLLKKEK